MAGISFAFVVVACFVCGACGVRGPADPRVLIPSVAGFTGFCSDLFFPTPVFFGSSVPLPYVARVGFSAFGFSLPSFALGSSPGPTLLNFLMSPETGLVVLSGQVMILVPATNGVACLAGGGGGMIDCGEARKAAA